ncbi:MAG: hypothetical protein V1816_17280 [Pseudomonadota bacterium]
MTAPKPLKITVEYDDGTVVAAPWDAMTEKLRLELERQPAFSRPSPAPEKDKYLILAWEDGWREVYKVAPECVDLNRYYVITRPESTGRLSLNKTDGYPELVEIDRRPFSLQSAALEKSWELTLDHSTREGNKVDHFFQASPALDLPAELRQEFRRARDEERPAGDLDALSAAGRADILEKIRKKMRLNAGFKQGDVIDYLIYLHRSTA